MWNRKLCLNVGSFGLSGPEEVKIFADAGFETYFFEWNPRNSPEKLVGAGKDAGLELQSIHAPFGKSAKMWGDDAEAGKDALDELTECLRVCEKFGAPIMIVHAFIGFEDHSPTPAGIERYGALAREAEKCGVKIALENTEGEEYLAALMEALRSEASVGFCWDSGHEMCYNHSKDMLALYGDRLIATHLNDNLGVRDFGGKITYIDDLHLLPFDGIADWDNNAARLDRCGFAGPLTFELSTVSKPGRRENDLYRKLSPEEYIAECYKRACRVAAKMKGAFDSRN